METLEYLYGTLYETLDNLYNEGFNDEFIPNLENKGFRSRMTGKFYNPEVLTIKKLVRLEPKDASDDVAIVYALESEDGAKGLFVDYEGSASNQNLSELISRFNYVEK